jgi:hypothetical protein
VKRRTFLAGAAAVAAQGWLGRAFAGAVAAPDAGVKDVRDALERARRLGKPLLVLVVPADRFVGAARGWTLGSWIDSGDGDAMRLLALCEIVAAPQAALHAAVPASGTAEALMVLVMTDRRPFEVRIDPGPLPEAPADRRVSFDGDRGIDEWDDHPTAPQRQALTERLAGLLLPDDAALDRLAAQARAALPLGSDAEIRRRLAVGELPAEEADRAAALLATVHGDDAPAAFDALGRAARARLRGHRIPGSYWGHATACADFIEDPPPDYRPVAMMCGMGSVSPKAARFLAFYVGLPARKDFP